MNLSAIKALCAGGKRRRSTPAMAKVNARNTERHIMRLIEANFHEGEAVVVTGTYAYPPQGDYAMIDVKAMAAEAEQEADDPGGH